MPTTDPTAHYSDPDLLQRQRDRWPVAVARAEAKVALGRKSKHVQPLINAAQGAATARQRVIWMHRAVTAWAQTLADLAACRAGCAHCCRVPVAITRTEAELLATASGRAIAADVREVRALDFDNLDEANAALREVARTPAGVPCPFLGADECCTVYDARPHACRALLNLDDDALLCLHSKDGACDVPYADARRLTALGLSLQPLEVADIRDYFPLGEPATMAPRSAKS